MKTSALQDAVLDVITGVSNALSARITALEKATPDEELQQRLDLLAGRITALEAMMGAMLAAREREARGDHAAR